MNKIKVAVLIAVYNDILGLERTLRTLPEDDVDLDIFVIDDGSVPPVSLPSFLRSNINVNLIRLEKNQGAAAARNAGLKEIFARNYKYVAVLDSGDIALKGRFEKTVNFLESNPDYALVGGQVRFLTPELLEVSEPLPTEYEQIRRALHARGSFAHSSITFRVDVLKELGGYNERYVAAHDYELIWRIVKRGYKVANLPDVLIEYYLNPKGLTMSKRRKQIYNKLKIMIKNFEPFVPESYLGLLKHSILLVIPFAWVWRIKRLFPRRPYWL